MNLLVVRRLPAIRDANRKVPDDELLFQYFFEFLDPLDAAAGEIYFDIACEFLVHQGLDHINDLRYLFYRHLLCSCR